MHAAAVQGAGQGVVFGELLQGHDGAVVGHQDKAARHADLRHQHPQQGNVLHRLAVAAEGHDRVEQAGAGPQQQADATEQHDAAGEPVGPAQRGDGRYQQFPRRQQAEDAEAEAGHDHARGVAVLYIMEITQHRHHYHGRNDRARLGLAQALEGTYAEPDDTEPEHHQADGKNVGKTVIEQPLADVQNQADGQCQVAQGPVPQPLLTARMVGGHEQHDGHAQGGQYQRYGQGECMHIGLHKAGCSLSAMRAGLSGHILHGACRLMRAGNRLKSIFYRMCVGWQNQVTSGFPLRSGALHGDPFCCSHKPLSSWGGV